MNSLNLRISAVKLGDNIKKNSETRALKVPLPEPYAASTSEYVETFRAAETVPQQVNAVKQIFLSADQNVDATRFLADLILYSPLNHPVRHQIITLFGRNSGEQQFYVAAMELAITEQIRLVKASNDGRVWNDMIVSIAGFFNNFPSGIEALKTHMYDFLDLMHVAIGRWMRALIGLKSPSQKSELYNMLHNTLRSVLSAMLEVGFDNVSFSSVLIRINKICEHIAIRADLPMEVCMNGARILGHISRYFGTYSSLMMEASRLNEVYELPQCISALTTFIVPYFPTSTVTFNRICKNLIRLTNIHATKQNVLIFTTRGLYQLARGIQQVPSETELEDVSQAHSMLVDMLGYAYAYMQHHIDTVRHLCRDVLREVMAAVVHFEFVEVKAEIYKAINGTRLLLPVRSILLRQSVLVFGPTQVTMNCKKLFEQIFNENLGRDADVDSAYEALLTETYSSTVFTTWTQVWLDFLFKIAALDDERLTATERLIMTAAVLGPSVIGHVMRAPGVSERTKLSALCAVRKSGEQAENLKVLLVEYANEIRAALVNANPAFSLMALRVIVECHKTTEPLTAVDCENINIYIKYHINCPDPDVRQKTFALLTKALVRCELSLARELKQRAAAGAGVGVGAPSTDSLHVRFLRDITEAMVANLFPSANYSRRWLALQLLEQCLTICHKLKFEFVHFMPKVAIERLIDVLGDSYEGNKVFAVQVLKLLAEQMPSDSIEMQKLNFDLEDIRKLLISLRPPDSVTATYKLELFCALNATTPQVFDVDPGHVVQHYPTIYAALNWCMLELQEGLELAEEDLRRAAKFNPLYGLLYAIRHLLKRLDFTLLAEEPGWRAFIQALVSCCQKLTAVVARVVNSSSPEGHLPNDFSRLTYELEKLRIAAQAETSTSQASVPSPPAITDARILAGPLSPATLERIQTTPQMVLLCSWRTVKEVSLILGELVLHSPLQHDIKPGVVTLDPTEPYLLTMRQVYDIGGHFRRLLSETKHRGAFEQAYVGFCMHCTRLWRANSVDLNSLPQYWADELIGIIMRPRTSNLCSTRRSAGLPFMMQALVTTELQIGSTKTLHNSITSLIQICACPYQEMTEGRMHAHNILRALFRCSELNESVGEHVAEALMCALKSYEAPTWPERNSASLLFAALMTRIFGVMRTKDADNLNIRNRMTGRIFFTRYPRLYDYFYRELREAARLVLAGEQSLKLYPMLLLLSRLYPSGWEGAETNLNLTNFVPLIAACSGVAELNTRCLTGKALCALLDKDALEELLREKCAKLLYDLATPASRDLNTMHGDLVQIEHLLKRCRLDNDLAMVRDVSGTLCVLARMCTLNNGMVLGTILDIMNLILEQYKQASESDFNFEIFANEHYRQIIDDCARYCKTIWRSYQIYILHVLRLSSTMMDMVLLLLKPTLAARATNSELLETTINVILLTLLGRGNEALSVRLEAADMEEFEFDAIELQFMRSLPDRLRLALMDEFSGNETLFAQILGMLGMRSSYPETAMKCYAILSLLKAHVFTLGELLTLSARFASDGKSAITMCIVRRVKEHGIPNEDWDMLLAHALELVDPALPDYVRVKSAYLYTQLAMHLEFIFHKRDLQLIGSYVRLVLQLLADDDETIRNYTSNVITQNLRKTDSLRQMWQTFEQVEFTTVCDGDVVPSLAQQLFIMSVADLLKHMQVNDAFLLGVFNVIVEPHLNDSGVEGKEANDKDKDKDKTSCLVKQLDTPKDKVLLLDPEIFDRNEANLYSEPLTVVYDTQIVFRRAFAGRELLLEQLKKYTERV